MKTQTEALNLALKALDGLYLPGELERVNKAITAIKEALAQPEQEPVAPEFDIKTSKGGRGYVEWYFSNVLRRHDFAHYILNMLAADFACALANGLSASPQPAPQPEQEPVATMTVKGGLISFAAKILADGTYDLCTTPPQRKPLTEDEIEKA